MNPCERFQAILTGQTTDRFPNFDIMMGFAAHFIGEPLARYYQDYRVLCAANFAVQEEFELDIVQAISDPYREAADAGLEVEFPEDGLPVNRVPLLQEPGDLGRLVFPTPAAGRRMSDRLGAIRTFREKVGGEIPIMGWIEGALAEAADLRGVSNLMIDLVERPEWVRELLERCTENAIAFAQAQIEAGADLIGLGDAVASQISPRMYRQFALPYEQRIFAAIRSQGAVGRLHICGNTSRLIADMAHSGAEILDIDWMVDMRAASDAAGNRILCGNLDPVAVFLQGTPQMVREGIQANARAVAPRWISMAGCEIPDGTPRENLIAQAETLIEIGYPVQHTAG